MKKFALLSLPVLLAACIPTAQSPARPAVTTLGFSAFNGQAAELRAQGVRIFGPNASVAQDLEPEFIAVAPDGRTAWVTLQENNALAVLDLQNPKVLSIVPLGYKDHNRPGAGLDPSDRDGGARVGPWPLMGMYQPDGIAAFSQSGQTFLVTANEGDARDYQGFQEEKRAGSLRLDPTTFPEALRNDAGLNRINVTDRLGDTDGDGDYDRLYSFGARSFSVWDAQGKLVYDSGELIERIVLSVTPERFNSGHTNNTLDDRSDNKGPEPEGLAIGNVGGKPFLYLGLERISGVMVFDLSDPRSPQFVQYLNNRDFSADPRTPAARDLGPEGLVFVPAAQSPNRNPLLIVSNEVSGTTTIYGVAADGRLAVLGSASAAGSNLFETAAAEIPAYEPNTQRLFVVNGNQKGIDVFALANPTQPTLLRTITIAGYAPNSVATRPGLVAVALEDASDKTKPGLVVFLDVEGRERGRVAVGSLPDMITFTPDGRFALTANEGEPNANYTVDPEGSVSLIDVGAVVR